MLNTLQMKKMGLYKLEDYLQNTCEHLLYTNCASHCTVKKHTFSRSFSETEMVSAGSLLILCGKMKVHFAIHRLVFQRLAILEMIIAKVLGGCY